ncbi:MAG: hypothetical protein EZS28_013413 [Streblomastix strix]|uniref:Uncharacterized protein n=1 Tax=Streblomastix strix TaxID=222440 RepID=A0A5J4W8V3_9EUKA|nr:MAG: hypothetical protein EZS28_013413 [Streblomastix strix]
MITLLVRVDQFMDEENLSRSPSRFSRSPSRQLVSLIEEPIEEEPVDVIGDQLRKRIAQLEQDVKNLDLENDRKTQDKKEMADYLGVRIRQMEVRVDELEKNLNKKERYLSLMPVIDRQSYNKQIIELLEEIDDYDQELRQGRKQLRKIDHYSSENTILSRNVESVREQLFTERQKYENELEHLKMKCEDHEQELAANIKKEMQQIRENATKTARKNLRQVSHDLIADTATQKLRLQKLNQQCRELGIKNKDMRDKISEINRSLDIVNQQTKMYQESKKKNEKEIERQQQQTTNLRMQYEGLSDETLRDRRALAHKAELEADIARSEADTLRRLLKRKIVELSQLRNISQMILNQRSDAEHFLIEALAYARENIKEEEMAKHVEEMEALRLTVADNNNNNITKSRTSTANKDIKGDKDNKNIITQSSSQNALTISQVNETTIQKDEDKSKTKGIQDRAQTRGSNNTFISTSQNSIMPTQSNTISHSPNQTLVEADNGQSLTGGFIKHKPGQTYFNDEKSLDIFKSQTRELGNVEFEKLSWRQKEHVLRLLYSKINTAEPEDNE